MSRTTHSNRNLAASMGRWSAAHWKTATFGWLAFVLVAFGLGGLAGTKDIDPNTSGPGESGRVDRILDAGFKQPAGESVLVQSRSLRTSDPAFTAAIEDVVGSVSKLKAVQHVRSPLAPGNADQIAKNGHAALVEFEIRGDPDKAADKIVPVLDGVAHTQRNHPQFFIGEFGDASSVNGVETAYGDDLAKAGLLSIPVTLIILVFTFGALVAAGIPLLLALTAIFATFGLLAGAQPPATDGATSPGDGAPDRACRRRRLLAVLLEARASGACRRAQRTRGARSRRCHLRPLRSRLGPHGDHGDGRHVPDRRPDLRLPRRLRRSSS